MSTSYQQHQPREYNNNNNNRGDREYQYADKGRPNRPPRADGASGGGGQQQQQQQKQFDAEQELADTKKFASDLYVAMCESCKLMKEVDKDVTIQALASVQSLYDHDKARLLESLGTHKVFPDEKVIMEHLLETKGVAADHIFWSFYRQITFKHLFNTGNSRLIGNKDYKDNFDNYGKIFKAILDSKNQVTNEMIIPTQWIYDMFSEFVYQYQGFCQKHRSVASTAHKSNPDFERMKKYFFDLWNYPDVSQLLKTVFKGVQGSRNVSSTSPNNVKFGYFACIELARLECITGDHLSSIKTISFLSDKSDLYSTIPMCYASIYYHLGVSQLMIRRYSDAMDTFSNITLYISGVLKPGASLSGGATLFITETLRLEQRHYFSNDRSVKNDVSINEGIQKRLKKQADKISSLAAICHALCPGKRLDDHVRLEINSNSMYSDKLHRLSEGDMKIFKEIFEKNCPAFVYPGRADYSQEIDHNQECFQYHVDTFMNEVEENISVLKLRSYLRLYAAIKVDKLARFSVGASSAAETGDFEAKLLSYKHKALQMETSITRETKPQYSSDIDFYINEGNVEIISANKKIEKENKLDEEFISGLRKHKQLADSLISKAIKVGLREASSEK